MRVGSGLYRGKIFYLRLLVSEPDSIKTELADVLLCVSTVGAGCLTQISSLLATGDVETSLTPRAEHKILLSDQVRAERAGRSGDGGDGKDVLGTVLGAVG